MKNLTQSLLFQVVVYEDVLPLRFVQSHTNKGKNDKTLNHLLTKYNHFIRVKRLVHRGTSHVIFLCLVLGRLGLFKCAGTGTRGRQIRRIKIQLDYRFR